MLNQIVRHIQTRIPFNKFLNNSFRSLDAIDIHDLKRTLAPSEPDLGPAVDILHAGYPFFNKVASYCEDSGQKAFFHLLGPGRTSLALKVPFLPGSELLLQATGWGIEFTRTLFQASGRMICYGNSGNVHQLERPHTYLEDLFCNVVYGGNIGNTLAQKPSRFIEPGYEKAVDSKAWSVSNINSGLADDLGKDPGPVHDLFGSGGDRDYLDQSIFGRVVEEMKADELIFPSNRSGQLLDRKG